MVGTRLTISLERSRRLFYTVRSGPAESMTRILVTNDDGVSAGGVAALAEAVARLGRVVVVAPEREMSAISHALTLSQPLRMVEVGEDRYAISGTPTDCVYIGIVKILGGDVDLVVSGINRGANLGEDIHYSGTVAGAVEGRLLGFPAIAFSQIVGDGADIDKAAAFAAGLAEAVLERRAPQPLLLNVNFPPGAARGVRLTRLGRRHYQQSVEENVDPRGRHYYWIGGGECHREQSPDTDVQAARDGYISVTPLQLDLTDADAARQLSSWDIFEGPR